jgi:hypothetical protein
MAAAGVCAVSVVTESKDFGGNLQMLRDVARVGAVPVFAKGFFFNTRPGHGPHTDGRRRCVSADPGDNPR